ncbi:hypothetical protein CR513_13084, partial [Mucuna pruriens]
RMDTEQKHRAKSLISIQAIQKSPKRQWCRAFKEKYGKILSILEVEVQLAALSVLTQFYDSPMRGHYPSWASIAKLARVPKSRMAKRKRNWNGIEGLPRTYLEERLSHLLEEEN